MRKLNSMVVCWTLTLFLAGDRCFGQTVETKAPAAGNTNPASEQDWHVNGTLYLWLPGIHGQLNAFDRNLGFKASPGDLLSNVDFGLMGLAAIQHKRLVIIPDLVWTRLSTTKARDAQFPLSPGFSAEVKFTQVVVTPEVGYRLIDDPKIKIEGLTGFRFWHLGTAVSPGRLPSRSRSNNWADPLVGARIQVPLSEKLMAVIWGDVGGWGVGSQLDYQIVGALSYKINPNWALAAGWRYLFIDYSQDLFHWQIAQSGIVLGVTHSLK